MLTITSSNGTAVSVGMVRCSPYLAWKATVAEISKGNNLKQHGNSLALKILYFTQEEADYENYTRFRSISRQSQSELGGGQ